MFMGRLWQIDWTFNKPGRVPGVVNPKPRIEFEYACFGAFIELV